MDFIKNIYYEIASFFRGVKNIIQYAPIIYKDRDWDYRYLEDLLLFKLKRMKVTLETGNNFEFVEETTKRIDFCIRILERMKNDYESYTHPDYKKWLDALRIDYVDSETKGYKRIVLSDTLDKERRDFYNKWYTHNYNRDRRLLFDVMKKYIDTWWD